MDLAETASSLADGPVSSFSAEFLYTTPGELSKGAGADGADSGNHARGVPDWRHGVLACSDKIYININNNLSNYKKVNKCLIPFSPD
jgi:hypothetical protein